MAEGLSGQAAGDDVRPRSAQLFGERQAEDAERGEPVPYLEAEFTPEIGLLAQRRHLVAPIAIDRLPESFCSCVSVKSIEPPLLPGSGLLPAQNHS
jgi:hypothetical protein